LTIILFFDNYNNSHSPGMDQYKPGISYLLWLF
jgi:hypothetical protein